MKIKRSIVTLLYVLGFLLTGVCLPVVNAATGLKSPDKKSSDVVIKIPSVSAGGQHGLSKQRFEEYRYGISFEQPAGTIRVLQTTDDAIAKYIFPGKGHVLMGFYIRHQRGTINLSFSKGKTAEQRVKKIAKGKKLTIAVIKKQAIAQFGFAYPSARLVKANSKINPAGRPATAIYFLVTGKNKQDWIAGQAFMLIDPHTVALFQMQCGVNQFKKTRQTFEALLNSVQMLSLNELNSIRHRRITAAGKWLETVTDKKMKEFVKTNSADQWYRILSRKKDVGYKRIKFGNGKDMGKTGLSVIVQTKLNVGKSAFNSLDQFFASYDGSAEVWSRRTQQNDKDNDKTRLPQFGALPTHAIWAETGVRSGELISVSRQSPLRIREYHWSKPVNKKNKPLPYISQAGMEVILGLLPHKKSGEFAFYAYNSTLVKITLHLVWVTPLDKGRFKVVMRPAADRAPVVLVYSDSGKLLRKKLTDGKILLSATKEQMRKAWHLPKQ